MFAEHGLRFKEFLIWIIYEVNKSFRKLLDFNNYSPSQKSRHRRIDVFIILYTDFLFLGILDNTRVIII